MVAAELCFEEGQTIPKMKALVISGVSDSKFRWGKNELLFNIGDGEWVGFDDQVTYIAMCATTIKVNPERQHEELVASLLRQRTELVDLLLETRCHADTNTKRSIDRLAELFCIPDAMGTFIPKLSRSDIHRMTGVNREYVSRHLSSLVEDDKLVRVEKEAISKHK